MGHIRFDTLEWVDRFQRELDSFGVWYDQKLDITSEGLYCLRYDKWDYEEKLREEMCEIYWIEY